jgi:hypothetical protein
VVALRRNRRRNTAGGTHERKTRWLQRRHQRQFLWQFRDRNRSNSAPGAINPDSQWRAVGFKPMARRATVLRTDRLIQRA